MRGFVSGLTALLAILLLPVAITAVWTAERVIDTDGYVAAVGPLADDADVQEALTDRLEQYAAEAVGLDRLGAGQEEVARDAIRSSVTRVLTSPTFRQVWESANRSAHGQLLRALSADTAGEITVLDLREVVQELIVALRQAGVPVRDVGAPSIEFRPDQDRMRAAQEAFQALDAAGTWSPVAWLALVVITFLVARKRLVMAGVLAGGSLVTVALLWPVLAAARTVAIDGVPTADRELAGAVWDALTASLDRAVLVAILVAAAVFVVAVALSVVRGRRPRSEPGAESAWPWEGDGHTSGA